MATTWTQPGVMHIQDEEAGERICRFCHEPDANSLISPCSCRGSIKWVHRECLDHWRAVSPNPDSFSTCDNCKTKYKVIVKDENRACLKAKFAALVSRDILLVIALVNLIIVGLGFLADLIVPTEKIVRQLAGVGAILMEYRVLRVYSFGGIVFFFFMGIAGIIFSFYKCCCAKSNDEAEERVSATSYAGYRSSTYDCYFVYCGPYYNPAYGYYYGPCGNWSCDCCCCCDGGGCGACDCAGGSGGGDCCSGASGSGGSGGGDCKCDGGGEGSAVLLVIGLVILAVVILIGLFFGVFLFTLVASKIVHRHIHVLNRSHRAQIYYVANLADPAEAAMATDLNDDRAEDIEPLLSGNNDHHGSVDSSASEGKAIRVQMKKMDEDDMETIRSVV